MHTLWLIIQREFVSNVLTSRFMIGFIVCLLSTAVAVFVQVDDYEKRLAGYNTAIREAQEETRTWELYVDIKPKAHRKPNLLGIFNVGTENFGANTVTVELSKPIFEFITFPIWLPPTQKRGSDNPFLAMFLAVDVVFIFKIVLSALAILFAYNTISGEREDGTLKLVLSNAVPRDVVVLGKYLGGMLSLFPIILVSLLVVLLISFASPVTAFDGNDIAHIILIFGVSLLYVSTWYLLGFVLYVWTKEAATKLII
ncbi:ABC transporter permease [Candidatus Poribacteria bacterium]|nr:ABC transporter permease [Candidatus Poribacteria bacterium]